MSTCISRAGEFSAHEFSDPNYPLTCQLCFVFDEDEANRRLRAARYLVGDWQVNGNSRALGDTTAAVWHLAARQLLAVLAGDDAHDVDPKLPANSARTADETTTTAPEEG
ncbi:hypothetical protein [Nocardioides soli]|uniref:Uncharacterized protein n=1 Tax=Nocardioides soli TaxID=1036020 RepID=A0A7W4Z0Z5_9ACTN|nr:hypothetical protein [Nocardioides soli]MBB3041000.1 hypothetical protein [Nocardioides soli]